MAEKRSRGRGKSFGGQKTTPKGGVIREGWRGDGADQRNVVKRLKLTPGETHRAEYETCDQEDCSSSKPRDQCAKFTKKNIKNARTAKSLPRMGEKELQEKNQKRPEGLQTSPPRGKARAKDTHQHHELDHTRLVTRHHQTPD